LFCFHLPQGNTSLHYAMSNGRFDIVRSLLDTEFCDVGRQNRTGCTAIMLASLVPVGSDDDRRTVERLMQIGDVNQRAALVRTACSHF
jgi:ankyrin repeat protein